MEKSIEKENIIALLPGSRQQEIGRNLPVMIQSAKEFVKSHQEYKIAVAKAGNVSLDKFITNDVEIIRQLTRFDEKS